MKFKSTFFAAKRLMLKMFIDEKNLKSQTRLVNNMQNYFV